jgi:hypothetical protein
LLIRAELFVTEPIGGFALQRGICHVILAARSDSNWNYQTPSGTKSQAFSPAGGVSD